MANSLPLSKCPQRRKLEFEKALLEEILPNVFQQRAKATCLKIWQAFDGTCGLASAPTSSRRSPELYRSPARCLQIRREHHSQ